MKSLATAGALDSTAEVGQTFFVAPAGNDGNDGSIERPFATIQHALEVARDNGDEGGDRIYLRAGTYRPTTSLLLLEHGGPRRWSRLAAWRGENVVIDGSRIAPVNGRPAPLILVEGSYYEIAGLELAGALKSGISIYAAHVRVIGNVIRDSMWGAVWSDPVRASCLFFAENVVFHNCLMNKPRRLAGGWPSAVNLTHHGDVVIGNRIYENLGEGFGVYGSHHYVAHNNVHDNFSAELYLNNATDTTLHANFVHSLGKREFFRDWNLKEDWTKPRPFWAPAQGIAMANESATDIQFARNRVVNNIVIGRRYRSLNWWNGFPAHDGTRNGGLVDSLIAHNTVVGDAEALFHIDDNDHPDTEIRDNVFLQRRPERPLTDFHGVGGITFSYNLRYGGRGMGPAGEGRGPGDVEQDPRLVDPGAASVADYRLRPDSPAIDAASSSAAGRDYFGNERPYGDSNDMGAHEWSSDS
jgi:hypothetical protein